MNTGSQISPKFVRHYLEVSGIILLLREAVLWEEEIETLCKSVIYLPIPRRKIMVVQNEDHYSAVSFRGLSDHARKKTTEQLLFYFATRKYHCTEIGTAL